MDNVDVGRLERDLKRVRSQLGVCDNPAAILLLLCGENVEGMDNPRAHQIVQAVKTARGSRIAANYDDYSPESAIRQAG